MKLSPKLIAIFLLILFVFVYFTSSSMQVKLANGEPVVQSQSPFSINLSAGPIAEGEAEKKQAEADRIAAQTQSEQDANAQQLEQDQQDFNNTHPQMWNSINFVLIGLKYAAVVGMSAAVLMFIGLTPLAFLIMLLLWLVSPKLHQKGDFAYVWNKFNPRRLTVMNVWSPGTYFEQGPQGGQLHAPADARLTVGAAMARSQAQLGTFNWKFWEWGKHDALPDPDGKTSIVVSPQGEKTKKTTANRRSNTWK